MIVCIALNPAIDVTYGVTELRVHQTNRIHTVDVRAGGKAVNVARVLRQVGVDVMVVLPAGGADAELFSRELRAVGIDVECIHTEHPVRRTIAVVSDESGDATVLAEAGRLDDWPAFGRRLSDIIAGADVVVATGSLPVGVPIDAYANIAQLARTAGKPVVIDTSGPALLAAIAAGAAVVKPNVTELTQATGLADPILAAKQLADATALSASAVLIAQAGEVDLAAYAEFARTTTVQELST